MFIISPLSILLWYFTIQFNFVNIIRSFVNQHWSALKTSAGTTPILVREAPNAPTRLIAVYPRGVERIHSLENADESAIYAALNESCAYAKTLPSFNPDSFALPSANSKQL